MTLKSRNRLLVTFIIFSSLFFILSSVRLFFSIHNNTILIPSNLIRPFDFKVHVYKIFSFDFYASISGIMFFYLYSIVVTIFLFIHFEKTQAIEVIYFMAFVIGCLLEGFRIFVPTENLWKSTSLLLALISRITISGKIAASFGLLFSVLFSETEQRQYVERNFIILFIIAILIGQMYPISTVEILTVFSSQMGERILFLIFQHIIMLSTLLVIIYEGISNHQEKLYRQIFGYLLIINGHNLLCKADCYFTLAVGIVFLATGSIIYLRYLHNQYLWK